MVQNVGVWVLKLIFFYMFLFVRFILFIVFAVNVRLAIGQEYNGQMHLINLEDSSVKEKFNFDVNICGNLVKNIIYNKNGDVLLNLLFVENDSFVIGYRITSDFDTFRSSTYSLYDRRWMKSKSKPIFPYLGIFTRFADKKTYSVKDSDILVYKHFNSFGMSEEGLEVNSYYVKGIGLFCLIDKINNELYMLSIQDLGYWKVFLESFINDYDFYQIKHMPAPLYPFD